MKKESRERRQPAPEHSPAYRRFLKSLEIGFAEWHDGTPYDLAALGEMPASEREEIRALLATRNPPDRRDVEALAEIARLSGDGSDREDLRRALKGRDKAARLEAAEALLALGEIADIGPIIAEVLIKGDLGDGLSEAEDLAARHPGPAVTEALLKGALKAKDDRGIRFAGLLFYLHGLTQEEFDWQHRPFFLRFGEADKKRRREAFVELCQRLGRDPAPYR